MTQSKILLIVLLAFVSSLINAQNTDNRNKADSFLISEGDNIVSLLINGFLTENVYFEYYGLRYGKLIKNRFVVGAEIGRSWYSDWEKTTHFGVYSRYYYAVFKHFLYYADTKYLFGLRNYDNETTASEWSGQTNNFAINAGISFTGFYRKRFGIEFFTGYTFNTLHIKNHPSLGEYNWSKNDIVYGFQVNYHFNTIKNLLKK